MARKPLQIADIARLANVSRATVSRALSGRPLINAETRDRIMAIARAQDYRVHASARNVRRDRTQTIGVLIPLSVSSRQHISDLFFLDLLGSIADALVDAEYDLLLSKPQESDWRSCFLDSDRADGLIVIGQANQHAAIEALARDRVAMAVWGTAITGTTYCTVGSDNEGGAFRATSHLLALGRRQIVFLGDATLPEVERRFSGYQRALAHHGRPHADSHYVSTAFTVEAATASVTRLLRSGLQFDAIFASSDVIAMTAIQTLSAAGIMVPEQVSVVGYDDIRMAAAYTPALTTVRQNIEAGGRELVARVLAQIDGASVGSIVLPTELVVRSSCGGAQRPAVATGHAR